MYIFHYCSSGKCWMNTIHHLMETLICRIAPPPCIHEYVQMHMFIHEFAGMHLAHMALPRQWVCKSAHIYAEIHMNMQNNAILQQIFSIHFVFILEPFAETPSAIFQGTPWSNKHIYTGALFAVECVISMDIHATRTYWVYYLSRWTNLVRSVGKCRRHKWREWKCLEGEWGHCSWRCETV